MFFYNIFFRAETHFAGGEFSKSAKSQTKVVQWNQNLPKSIPNFDAFTPLNESRCSSRTHYYMKEPTNTSIISSHKSLADDSISAQSYSRLDSRPPSTSIYSSETSQWNLYPETATEVTILRRQDNRKQQKSIVQQQNEVVVEEHICPPIPPKKRNLLLRSVLQPKICEAPPIPERGHRSRASSRKNRRTTENQESSNEKIYETICGQSPDIVKNFQQKIRSKSGHQYKEPIGNQNHRPSSVATYNRQSITKKPELETVGEIMGIRSASSNEIFKLYQTRDCLGNLLYEL